MDKMTSTLLDRIQNKVLRILTPVKKTWNVSQEYEFIAAKSCMDDPHFGEHMAIHKTLLDKKLYELSSTVFLQEFFSGDQKKFSDFVEKVRGKNSLEIGPSCATILGNWWWSKHNYVIEPLFDKIQQYQQEKFGYSIFDGITNYAQGAEHFIPELEGKIDGAVICRNCIDHSPHWAFILSNIVSYMAPGASLLIWNDIHHNDGVDDGHYEITDNIDNYKRLLNNLGLSITHEFSYDLSQRNTINHGCVAIKNARSLELIVP